eukprot:GHVU01057529.1.p1 GENE.GHVU01057529.1~~GHVU01057529.1.p1  ORF type:complete len:123 (-),score=0.35 GHVU01057529.1:50-418(-)
MLTRPFIAQVGKSGTVQDRFFRLISAETAPIPSVQALHEEVQRRPTRTCDVGEAIYDANAGWEILSWLIRHDRGAARTVDCGGYGIHWPRSWAREGANEGATDWVNENVEIILFVSSFVIRS